MSNVRLKGRLVGKSAALARRNYRLMGGFFIPLLTRQCAQTPKVNQVLNVEATGVSGFVEDTRVQSFLTPGLAPKIWSSYYSLDYFQENSIKFRSFKNVFAGASWEDTPLFQHYAAELASGKRVKNCRDMRSLKSQYQFWSEELVRISHSETACFRTNQPIYIHISKTKQIVWGSDGHHRLSIALLLGRPSLMVRVWSHEH